MSGFARGTRHESVGPPVLGEVLCVEDDPVIQLMLGDIVRNAGGQHHSAASAAEAELALKTARFDLVLLDRRLPDSDGLLLLSAVKQSSDCPVIVLSAMDETRDKILGLGLGAAEYVTKPFNATELSSRVRYLLAERSRARAARHARAFRCGRMSFEPQTRRLSCDAKTAYLPPAEARLLECLLRSEGEVLSRDQLMRFTCGRDWTPGDRTIDVLVARLRRRIPDRLAEIVTVHRSGYLFVQRG